MSRSMRLWQFLYLDRGQLRHIILVGFRKGCL
jgi:hypothetical protein